MTEKRGRGRPPTIYPDFEDGPFVGLKRHAYPVIMCDPPWHHRQFSAKGFSRHPSRHYATMPIDQIRALPVGELAAKDAWLMLWTTWPHLEEALGVIRAWGFKYSSNFNIWIKLNPTATDLMFMQIADFATITGYTTRKNSEPLILARRGRPQILDKNVKELLIAPRREHSRKPDEAYRRVERFCPGPRMDLFGRESRPGWDKWGLESTKFDAADPAPYSPIKLSMEPGPYDPEIDDAGIPAFLRRLAN